MRLRDGPLLGRNNRAAPTATAITATVPKIECVNVYLANRYAPGPKTADTRSASAIVPAITTPNTNHHGRRGKIPRANANDVNACVAGSTVRVSTKKQWCCRLSPGAQATSEPLAQSKIPQEGGPARLHPPARKPDSHPAARTPAYPPSRNAHPLPCAGFPSRVSAGNSDISGRSASSAPSLQTGPRTNPPGP